MAHMPSHKLTPWPIRYWILVFVLPIMFLNNTQYLFNKPWSTHVRSKLRAILLANYLTNHYNARLHIPLRFKGWYIYLLLLNATVHFGMQAE